MNNPYMPMGPKKILPEDIGNIMIVLASSGSARLFGHPNPKISPVNTPVFYYELFLKMSKNIMPYLVHVITCL